MSTFLEKSNPPQQNASFEMNTSQTIEKNRFVFHKPIFLGLHPLKFRQVSKKIFAAPPVCGTVTGSSLKPCANKAKMAEVLGEFAHPGEKNTHSLKKIDHDNLEGVFCSYTKRKNN